jgi:hypothetical protein
LRGPPLAWFTGFHALIIIRYQRMNWLHTLYYAHNSRDIACYLY